MGPPVENNSRATGKKRIFDRKARSEMAGIATAQRMDAPSTLSIWSPEFRYLVSRVKTRGERFGCGKCHFLCIETRLLRGRGPSSIAGFGLVARQLHRHMRQVFGTQRVLTFGHSSGTVVGPRRPSRPPCTNFCRKKIVEKQLGARDTLAVVTWLRCGPDPRHFCRPA
jgi:hypothetical protein